MSMGLRARVMFVMDLGHSWFQSEISIDAALDAALSRIGPEDYLLLSSMWAYPYRY